MIAAMMQGRVLTWSVKLPRIIESNGEISSDSDSGRLVGTHGHGRAITSHLLRR